MSVVLCAARVVALLGACWGLGVAQSAVAQDFYKGKTLSIIVGNSAGGGLDAYARLLARHYARHIAGNPTVIVQNVPGAATLKSVQYLDAGSPKDGTVMTTFAPDIVTQSLLEPETMKMNFTQFSWVGSITRDFRACYAWHASGVKSWDDLVKHPKFNVGSGAVGSSSYINGAILIQVFGVKINQVLGYPGSSEIRIALERGELDGSCGSWSSVPANWIDERKIYPLVRFSALDLPGAASAPYVVDLAGSESEKRALNLLLAAGEVARPYIMSRAVPADRLAILRKAFDASMIDPQFLADAEKQKLPVTPIAGAEAAALINAIYASSESEVAAAREAIR